MLTQANSNRFSGRSNNKQLIDWVNNKLDNHPDTKVKDLTRSWQDGKSFCALIHVLGCDIDFTGMKFDSKNVQIANMNRAFASAHDKLNIPKLLDGEDVVEVQDQKSITTYLFEIQKKFSRSPSQVFLAPKKEELSESESSLIPTTETVGVEEKEKIDAKVGVSNSTTTSPPTIATLETIPLEAATQEISEMTAIELENEKILKMGAKEEEEAELLGDFSPSTMLPDSKANEVRVAFKVVVIGNSSVGKTCILERFQKNHFQPHTVSTIGIDSRMQSYRVGGDSGEVVTFNIFDTAGQEKYRSLTRNFFRGAHGVVLVYDVTNADSFAAVESWIADIRSQLGVEQESGGVRVILVGNKTDLANERAISTTQGRACAESNAFCFMETSAQSGRNVARAFQVLMQEIYAGQCARLKLSAPQTQSQADIGQKRITLRKEKSDGTFVDPIEVKVEENSCYC
jgi:Ras-related protein Rab-1A